ncbi:hypothetical protein NG895_28605 [Aeoliella sp. ICT_H6.2]|uniref:Transposase IS200-like domain-containing protein n=1 Tax=Aeoliella straminimaris TaxID=2954799 RepID=A0A9X2FF09_9BACT|nr:hypothetical protein [Aeoliella straminimaris]MCO6047885.1 hypothetical protein [Aeoliella straminimaris]
MQRPTERRDYLKRLPPGYYRAQAYVHWSLTVEGRRQGWLKPVFYYRFRELLTHTAFRYEICCPIFCCMPDHFHLLWLGISDDTDQRVAMKFFRRHLNATLKAVGFELQSQGHDHVLTEEQREKDAFETVVEYVARNPERAGLVQVDAFRDYPYTSCLLPGYPEIKPFTDNHWPTFWRVYSHLRQHGVSRGGWSEETAG